MSDDINSDRWHLGSFQTLQHLGSGLLPNSMSIPCLLPRQLPLGTLPHTELMIHLLYSFAAGNQKSSLKGLVTAFVHLEL